MAHWPCRKLNNNGASDAPPYVGDESFGWGDPPCISQFNDQLHVAYISDKQQVWDVFCTPIPHMPARWTPQRVDKDKSSDPVVNGPSVGVYGRADPAHAFVQQQHFCYIKGTQRASTPETTTVFDSFFDLSTGWHSQTIDLPYALWMGYTFGEPFVRFPFLISIWNVDNWNQQHFTALCNVSEDPAIPTNTDIMDAFYDGSGWQTQKLNNRGTSNAPPMGNTDAPPAFSAPSGCVFVQYGGLEQQHVGYLAGDGSIWDVWFDGVPGNPWRAQRLNGHPSKKFHTYTDAPTSITMPHVWAVPPSHDFYSGPDKQLHFTYEHDGGEIWDVWFDGPENKWKAQKLNIDGSGPPFHTTNAPAAFHSANPNEFRGTPTAVVVFNVKSGRVNAEQHVAYRDDAGIIWDLWYDGDREWKFRQINDGTTQSPAAFSPPSLCYYFRTDTDGTVYGQLHCAWATEGGEIWDASHDFPPLPLGEPGGRG